MYKPEKKKIRNFIEPMASAHVGQPSLYYVYVRKNKDI